MKLRRISLAVLSVLLSAVTALSGFMVYTQLSDRQKEKEEFDTLAEMVEVTPEKPNDEAVAPTDDTSKPVRDLSGLFAQNSDCIGWLCIPGTVVNYPVMHTPENPQKYLRRSFYGESSQSGVPFLDRRCSLDSDNLIIYGHNMKDGTMFSSLRNYTDPAFCAAHPVIEFQTADGADQYTVFAVAAVQKTDDWYSFIYAADSADFSEQTAVILQKSLYDTGVTPVYGRQIITLSTCYGSGKNGRLIVAAVKP